MKIIIYGPELTEEEGSRLMAQNERFMYLMSTGCEIGMIFHIVSSIGTFIRTDSEDNPEAKQLHKDLSDGKDVMYHYSFELSNGDDVDVFNEKLDTIFWEEYSKKIAKTFNLSRKHREKVIKKMKEEGTEIPDMKQMMRDLKKDK